VTKHEREMETIAVFVHGALASLHILGMIYNWRKGNKADVIAHGLAAGYDVYATQKHMRRASKGE
jgi:hypothetical protein